MRRSSSTRSSWPTIAGVAVLLTRRAVTNKGEDYENVYGMFFEIVDGKIQTQVELLDFRVAADKFDLSVLE